MTYEIFFIGIEKGEEMRRKNSRVIVRTGDIGIDKRITQYEDGYLEIYFNDGSVEIFKIGELDCIKKKTLTKFGKIIKEIMIDRGVNVYELSYRTGVPELTIARYFNNKKGVKTFDMLRLIYGLGFTIDSFNHYINTLDF